MGLANKVFANGGLALAQISNSVTDIDFSSNGSSQKDPDDSFSDRSVRLGWVIGIGAEVSLSEGPIVDKWSLRLEGSYMNFGEASYSVNDSGDNICGPGGPRRPCSYNIKNEVGLIRVAIVHRFSL